MVVRHLIIMAFDQKTIAIPANHISESIRNLLRLLEAALPIRFVSIDRVAGMKIHGIIADITMTRFEKIARSLGVPILLCPVANPVYPAISGAKASFSNSPEAPHPFRGRAIEVTEPINTCMDHLPRSATSLCRTSDGGFWCRANEMHVRTDTTSWHPGLITQSDSLFDVFSGKRFLALLPWIEFLYHVIDDRCCPVEPLRACFMFDDPNLHWARYGHIRYDELAHHAIEGGYHVSFATVPADTWFVHCRAARTFAQNRSVFSLVFHGNNHTKNELAVANTSEKAHNLLQQALARIAGIERHRGLHVARIMAAPHGACSVETLQALAKCGFMGITISPGALRAHNPGCDWYRSMGLHMAEWAFGLPVFSRFRMSPHNYNAILLAAYLKQPIIIAGHHRDARNRYELIDKLASFVNGIGNVKWCDLESISNTNVQTRRDGEILTVKLFSRFAVLQFPHGIRMLECWLGGPVTDAETSLLFSVHNGNPAVQKAICTTQSPARFIVGEDSALNATISVDRGDHAFPSNYTKRIHVGALLRRLATEARDQIQGMVES